MNAGQVIFGILHVVAAVFIIGPMAILPMTAMRAVRAGATGQVRTLAKSVNIFGLLSLLVVIFGFGALAFSDHATIASTWIWLSLVLYIVSLGLTLFIVVPALRRAADTVDAEVAIEVEDPAAVEESPAKAAGYGAIAGTSGIASLLLVAVVVLMVWRP